MAWYDLDQIGQPVSQTIQFGRVWTFQFKMAPAARATALPAHGTDVSALPKFANVGCTGITGIGARVKSVTVSPPKQGGDCILNVQVIEPQGYSADATGPELRGSRQERRTWNGQNVGEMLFASTARTGSGIPTPNVTYFTNLDGQAEGGMTGRICEYLTQDKDTIPGVVFTRAHFRAANWTDYRKVGVAKVSLRGLTTQEEMLFDRDGYPIQGDGRNLAYFPNRWRITKGSAVSLTQKAIIVIETAYASLNPAELLKYVNTVNSGNLSRLGLGARTCRMLPPNATRWWKQGSLWYADYAMLYDPKAEHNEVYSLNETQVPIQMPEYDENFAVLEGKTRTVFQWMPCLIARAAGNAKTATTEQPRPPYKEIDWSGLDGMIEWT